MNRKIKNSLLQRILSLAVLMLVPALAQAYIGFCYQLTINCLHWEQGILYPTMDFEWIISCYDNEVSIDGKTYYMFYSRPAAYPTTSRSAGKTAGDDGLRYYTLGIRKADGRVYVNYAEYLDHLSKTGFSELEEGFLGNPDHVPYHITDDGEMILYDYTMEVGDQYRHVDGYEDVSVVEKDMVTLNDGAEHRRLTLSNGLVLVEGLGCINSTGLLLDYLNPATDNNWLGASLAYVETDSGYLFKDETYTPHVDGVMTIHNSPELPSQLAYDLQGRRLSSPPTKGIYIQDNKKIMRR